jgi:predicted DNA-binding protein
MKLTSQITIRLSDELREWLTGASAADGRSASNYIVRLIEAARIASLKGQAPAQVDKAKKPKAKG